MIRFAATLLTLFATACFSQTRPNLLLIVTDNQSPLLLGAYGNPVIQTPNIDRLAETGLLFEEAFSATGVCSPSRATMMTGLMPSQTGVHNGLPARFAIPDYSAIEEFRNLPQTLADAGYYTALIGKHHLGVHDRPQLGYHHWVTFLGGHTSDFFETTIFENGENYPLASIGRHMTDFWTDKAVDFISEYQGKKPFFLMLSYNGPYALPPTVNEPPTNQFAAQYEDNPPPMPQQPVNGALRNWAKAVRMEDPNLAGGSYPWAAIDALNNPRAIVNVAAETTLVDHGIGKVLVAIEEQGLTDDTLIVFTADQGAAFGQRGLWGNSSWGSPSPAYDANMRVPLILKHDSRITPARRSEAIRQTDLLPTLLDYLGLGRLAVKDSPGRSFVPLIEGNDIEWDDNVYWEYLATRVIRTKQWKLIDRFQGNDELYFIAEDAEEKHNLISEEAVATQLAKLRHDLGDFFRRFSNPEFDPWQGGTGKALLFYSRDDDAIFLDAFPEAPAPFVEKRVPFRDR